MLPGKLALDTGRILLDGFSRPRIRDGHAEPCLYSFNLRNHLIPAGMPWRIIES